MPPGRPEAGGCPRVSARVSPPGQPGPEDLQLGDPHHVRRRREDGPVGRLLLAVAVGVAEHRVVRRVRRRLVERPARALAVAHPDPDVGRVDTVEPEAAQRQVRRRRPRPYAGEGVGAAAVGDVELRLVVGAGRAPAGGVADQDLEGAQRREAALALGVLVLRVRRPQRGTDVDPVDPDRLVAELDRHLAALHLLALAAALAGRALGRQRGPVGLLGVVDQAARG